jgi:hypothetical protein
MTILKAADVTIGMEVAARSWKYDWESKFGKVVKITPSGQIVVQLEYPNLPNPTPDQAKTLEARFDKHGREIASGSNRARDLVPAQELRDSIALKEVQKLAKSAINKIRQEMEEVREWGPEYMLEYLNVMQQKIIAAKIHVVEYQCLKDALNRK